MKIKNKNIKIFLASFLLGFICSAIPLLVFAQDEPDYKFLKPILNVEIPGFSFQETTFSDGAFQVSILGQYIGAIYNLSTGLAVVVAIVMIMWGGVRRIMSSAAGDVGEANKIIGRAIIGLVLVLGSYLILYTISPGLVFFSPLTIDVPERQAFILEQSLGGYEGEGTGTNSLNDLPADAKALINKAVAEGECNMTESFGSITGKGPMYPNYHWFSSGTTLKNYDDIKALDWTANWGDPIYAPFSGTVEFDEQTVITGNRCGNMVTISGTGPVVISICHLKDFCNESGGCAGDGDSIAFNKGDIIGHVGGVCCAGQTFPSEWSSAPVQSSCTVAASPQCTTASADEVCTCQEFKHSGNTTGAHAHVTWYYGGNFLACLEM